MSSRMTSRAGSSPLARGLHGLVEGQGLVDGIIPARAGFTSSWRPARTPPRDHPRSRGVYIADAFSLLKEQGSSPLARGLRPRLHGDPLDDRIIPARAGFTRDGRFGRRWRRDHPRSRGVYNVDPALAPARGGSSPLARGLPPSAPASPTSPTDHPRSRGVYLACSCVARALVGSSPLARGLPGRCGRDGR